MARGSVCVEIGEQPEVGFAAVADVTRIGEWSPECTAAGRVDGAETALH